MAAGATPVEFRRRLTDEIRWAEDAGCRGTLVHSDNKLLDPWAAAQMIMECPRTLVPMVAVNPAYIHPFSAARMISTLGFLYRRQVNLNYVTGGFHRHLRELGCELEHDTRYTRLVEYADIVSRLLSSERPVSHAGEFTQVRSAKLSPPLPG